MDGSGGPSGASWGIVPTWDGKPESFSHFLHEIRWTVKASKKEDRVLLGPKLIRKALQSGNPTLVQLLYKLEPSDFTTEDDLQKLIKFLEESPLNRQALPDAGNKIGSYYRRLRKRPMESVPAFLVREDRVHDEMLRALQRLLREKELQFDTYDVTIQELRDFCGFQGDQSLYYGRGDESEEEHRSEASGQQESGQRTSERTPTPRGKGRSFSTQQDPRSSKSSSSAASESPVTRGKDLLQRLMEKGLIPLAALDFIRGWMILEMSTQNDEERRLIRAATRNHLGYTEIKAALLSMYEEKAHRIPMDPKGLGKARAYFGDGPYNGNEEEAPMDGTAATFQAFQGDDQDYDNPDSPEWGPDPWLQDAWWQQPEWNDEDDWEAAQMASSKETAEDTEAYAQLLREQEEAEQSFNELQALMEENQRNLWEARKAVSEAARDRGWNQGPQQRQPKFTSAYPGKGKSS